jgi:hypothetical protein
MKKCLTCTLIFISISYFIRAQENISSDFAAISTPYRYVYGEPYSENNLLFENWLKAKLLTANNSIITNDSFLFNFDKINRRLLITTDFNTIYEIDNREFKAILFFRHDSTYIFKHVYSINEKDLFQVLVNSPNKYSLYKVMRAKIVKNRFSNTIYLSPDGKPIDLYINIPEYYIFFPNKDYRKIHSLKKGSIQRIFKLNPDLDIVDEYLRLLGDKSQYDERDLVALVSYLNSVAP